MEDPPFPTHPPYNSKRMFAASGGGSSGGGGGGGSSSSSFVDVDVIEIPPPPTWKSNRHKHNSTVNHEVIYVGDDDPDDIVIVGETFAPKSKGKKPMHDNHADKGTSSTDATIIDGMFSGVDLSDISYDDDCVMLQAHFDNFDVPTGVEASVPWWPKSAANQSGNSSSNAYDDDCVMLQAHFDNLDVPKVAKEPKPWLPEPYGISDFAFPSFPHPYDPYLGIPPSGMSMVKGKNESWTSPKPTWFKKLGSKSKSSHFNSKSLPSKAPTASSVHVPGSSGMIPSISPWVPHHSKKNPYMGPTMGFPFPHENYGIATHGGAFPNIQSAKAAGPNPFLSGFVAPYASHPINLDEDISAHISPPCTSGGDTERSMSTKLEAFKKFDTLDDYSDHLYKSVKESVKQTKSWSRTIAEEWRMLEKDLPDTIFVRVYEERMDLLRAVILGADGTPYHDGLFFFDVNFTCAYPKSPPHVKYHAHGLRINPNLYNCGKVCLSLLGTWSGSGEENWRPGKSNMLQVLVSIQGLILNAEPYYNEPGYANSKNSSHGQSESKKYSENTFLLSLKTMLYTMKNPPKFFEDLIFGHFFTRAHDILAACRAYLDGVEVGSFDKSKTANAQKKGGPCSAMLKSSLPGYIKSLVQAFTKIGVKDCEKYLVSPSNGVNHPGEGSSQTTRKKSKR